MNKILTTILCLGLILSPINGFANHRHNNTEEKVILGIIGGAFLGLALSNSSKDKPLYHRRSHIYNYYGYRDYHRHNHCFFEQYTVRTYYGYETFFKRVCY